MEDCFLSLQTNLMSPGYLSDPSPRPTPKKHIKYFLALPQDLCMCYPVFCNDPIPATPTIELYGLLPGFTEISAPMSPSKKSLPGPTDVKQYYIPRPSCFSLPALFLISLSLPDKISLLICLLPTLEDNPP